MDKYLTGAYQHIEGWLQRPAVWALSCVASLQEQWGVTGGVCEIGIHHGKFFLALENASRTNEQCIAIDIFADQTLNIDRSGRGDLDIFQMHLRSHANSPSRVVVKSLDSTSRACRDFLHTCDPVRLFSVDGGHTIQHVISDLRLAESVLADGGVIFVDDYFNPAFPSVTEGLVQYLKGGYSALAPIATVGGKCLLSGISYKSSYVKEFKNSLKHNSSLRAKTVDFCGYYFWNIMPVTM